MTHQNAEKFHIRNSGNDLYAEPGEIDRFWHHAELEKTYKRDHPRMAVKRCKYDLQYGRGRFRGLRRYKNPETGERRDTIEIWPEGLNGK